MASLGTLNTWGNITTYITSWLRVHDPSIEYEHTLPVLSFGIAAMAFTMPLGGQLEQLLGPRLVVLLGAMILSAGWELAPLCSTPLQLVLCIGLMQGVGAGLTFTTPMATAFRWFPHKRGMVSGIMMAAICAGASCMNVVSTKLANPNYLEPTVTDAEGDAYYASDSEVVGNVERMCRVVGIVCGTGMAVGAMCLFSPPQSASTSIRPVQSKSGTWQSLTDCASTITPPSPFPPSGWIPDVPPRGIATSRQGWLLWFAFFAMTLPGVFIVGQYKTFANTQPALRDDHFLLVVGSFFLISNSAGRLLSGLVTDYIHSATLIQILAICLSALLASFPQCVHLGGHPRGFFVVWLVLLGAVYGSTFSVFPVVTVAMFGPRYAGPNYGLIYSAVGAAFIAGSRLINAFMDQVGFEVFAMLIAIGPLCACLVTFWLRFPVPLTRDQSISNI